MKITFIAYGSRGDVQPIIALASGLQSAGYDVTIAAGVNFQTWVESHGLAFKPFSTDVQAMMNSDSGKEWIENSSDSPLKEAQNMRRMIETYEEEMSRELMTCGDGADVLISGLPTFGMIESVAEKNKQKHIAMMLAPLLPTKSASATLVPMVPKRDIFLNRWSGYIGLYFLWSIFGGATNRFRAKLGQAPFSVREYIRRWTTIPMLYGFSPAVVPHPTDLHDKVATTGYWFHNQADTWQPPQALLDFLDAGQAPVYIGFGSMANKNPEATTHLMIEALQQANQRGIIYSGWAGLQAKDVPDSIFLLDGAPHDWLFPRMKAVIHHGGAGTTAAALRAGVPSTIVSHMADQPYWGQRVYDLGVGGQLIRRHQLTASKLAESMRMMDDSAMRERAQSLANRIQREDGVSEAVQAILRFVR